MDSNIISWSIVILTTISLIYYFKIRNRRKEQKIFSVLQSYANEYNCIITNYDHWYNCQIGMSDTNPEKLFFIRTINNEEFKTILNLSEVLSCRLVKQERHVQIEKEVSSVIDRIEIVFSYKDKHKKDIALEFYNSEYDQLTIWRELELAQKWLGIVKSVIVTNQIRVKEAGKVNLLPSSEINKSLSKKSSPFHLKRKPKKTEMAF
ncbi:MAG: hypothetical protein K9H49_15755 [Bacteroidales bacterium]|nr:hypothetical protein [Bacteroidales bacterium]MCF8391063.1 hypothetical protein [Bacteroidales bacterium]